MRLNAFLVYTESLGNVSGNCRHISVKRKLKIEADVFVSEHRHTAATIHHGAFEKCDHHPLSDHFWSYVRHLCDCRDKLLKRL